jgi:hypothetical protein
LIVLINLVVPQENVGFFLRAAPAARHEERIQRVKACLWQAFTRWTLNITDFPTLICCTTINLDVNEALQQAMEEAGC